MRKCFVSCTRVFQKWLRNLFLTLFMSRVQTYNMFLNICRLYVVSSIGDHFGHIFSSMTQLNVSFVSPSTPKIAKLHWITVNATCAQIRSLLKIQLLCAKRKFTLRSSNNDFQRFWNWIKTTKSTLPSSLRI